mgnify:CR=1 FL=1
MRSGQTDDVFGVNRPSVLHRHDDAWFSEFIIFASHLNLYTLHKALHCLYPQRLHKDIGWKLCKKSKYLQLWQCKHLPSNGLRTEKCSFSHDYTEGTGIIAEFHYDNPPLPRLMHIEKGFEQQVRCIGSDAALVIVEVMARKLTRHRLKTRKRYVKC